MENELSWLFTNGLSATIYMKVKRMGITEILRRIWLFSANKIKMNLLVNNQLNSSLQHIIVTQYLNKCFDRKKNLFLNLHITDGNIVKSKNMNPTVI